MPPPAWDEAARDAAYTSLCEAVTAAGPAGETAFLARLCLLLMEASADPPSIAQAIRDAAQTTE